MHIHTPPIEVDANRHPILPSSEHYDLRRVVHDIDRDRRRETIELTLCRDDDRRVLWFEGVESYSPLRDPVGLYILDLAYRQWEKRIEVGEYCEDMGVYFIADSVEDVTSPANVVAADD